MIEDKEQTEHYKIWKRFDELCDQMSEKDKTLCSHHKYFDVIIKSKDMENEYGQ